MTRKQRRADRAGQDLATAVTLDHPGDADIERAAVYMFHSVVARQWRRDRLADCRRSLPASDAAVSRSGALCGDPGRQQSGVETDRGDPGRRRRCAARSPTPANACRMSPRYIELAVRLGGLINTRAMECALPGASNNRRAGSHERDQAPPRPRLDAEQRAPDRNARTSTAHVGWAASRRSCRIWICPDRARWR